MKITWECYSHIIPLALPDEGIKTLKNRVFTLVAIRERIVSVEFPGQSTECPNSHVTHTRLSLCHQPGYNDRFL